MFLPIFMEAKDYMKIRARIIVGAAFAVAGVLLLIKQFSPGWHEKSEIKEVQEIADVVEIDNKEEAEDSGESTAVPVDFDALRKINPDIVGWIIVEGTEISYPIMQSSEDEEEDFYLYHSFLRESSSHGSIYMQKINSEDFSDFNTVIYGHNMRDGTMFGQLHRFRDKDFFEENDEITIYTPDGTHQYRIFAAYITENEMIFDTWGDFENDVLKGNYIEFLKGTAGNQRDAKITVNSRIITLSTCCGDDAKRLLVQAVEK